VGKCKALDDLIRYISTNQEQMHYAMFRSKGSDIGSAAVEGACKNVANMAEETLDSLKNLPTNVKCSQRRGCKGFITRLPVF